VVRAVETTAPLLREEGKEARPAQTMRKRAAREILRAVGLERTRGLAREPGPERAADQGRARERARAEAPVGAIPETKARLAQSRREHWREERLSAELRSEELLAEALRGLRGGRRSR
jgi:hypothetical protein